MRYNTIESYWILYVIKRQVRLTNYETPNKEIEVVYQDEFYYGPLFNQQWFIVEFDNFTKGSQHPVCDCCYN